MLIRLPLLFLFLAFLGYSAKAQSSFELKFEDDTVHVSATFQDAGSVLAMITGSSEQSENGQQDFVSDLKVTLDGVTQSPELFDVGRWRIEGLEDEETSDYNISYSVALSFDGYTWNSGKEEMAYQIENGWYFSMRSLFIWPLNKYDIDEEVEIKFSIGDDQQLISPWNFDDLQNTEIVIPNYIDFLYNSFLIGNFEPINLEVQGLQFSIVYTDDLINYRSMIEPIIEKNAVFYSSIFAPKEGYKYLITISRGSRNDGGAFETSFAQTINGKVNETSRSFWGALTAHELFHLWSGRDLTYASANEEWILEGFADYYSTISLSKTDILTQEQVLRRIENSIRKYMIGYYEISQQATIYSSGIDKGMNRMLIYGGGASAAFFMDLTIRKKTNLKYGLNDALKSLYSKRSKGPFTSKELIQEIQSVTSVDLSDFFLQFISGRDIFQIENYAAELGLQIDMFGYEDVQFTILENENELRKSLLGF